MKNSFLIIFALTFLGCANSSLINIEGKVAMYGSMPHTYLAIKDNKNHKLYKIINSKDFNLINMQNRVLEVKAKILNKKVGPGFPAVIKVIKVSKKAI
jgi:hypothetical protein